MIDLDEGLLGLADALFLASGDIDRVQESLAIQYHFWIK